MTVMYGQQHLAPKDLTVLRSKNLITKELIRLHVYFYKF